MKIIKIFLDIIMTLSIILLMKLNVTGIQLHELLGIIIFALFTIHKLLNFKFMKAIGKNIFNRKLTIKVRVIFILDLALLLFMIASALTGILISKCLFTWLTVKNVEGVTLLHKFSAWWLLILISIHIGFHLDRMVKFFKKKYKFLESKLIKYIVLMMYILIAILGILSLSKYSIYSKIIPIFQNQRLVPTNQERKYENQMDNVKEKNISGNRFKNHNENPRDERNKTIKTYHEQYGNKKDEIDSDTIMEGKGNRKYQNKATILDVINIMLFFVGGTYYINDLLNKKKTFNK